MDGEFSSAWLRWRERVDLEEYDARWERLEAAGKSVHGEADFVADLAGLDSLTVPDLLDILDAGCGTGRVAVELARRGHRLNGVDNDPELLAYARRKPEPVQWHRANLATVELDERFDLVFMAGNILNFAIREQRPLVVANLARHLRPGGVLVNGCSVAPDCSFDQIDRWCDNAGLTLEQQFASWDRQPYHDGAYRVSVHRRPPSSSS